MTNDAKNGIDPSVSAERLVRRAEEKARAAVADAIARAEAGLERAGASAGEVLEKHQRRAEGRVTLLAASRRSLAERQISQSGTNADSPPRQPAAVSAPDRETISRHAYFKAAERGFAPGQETKDWLEAERELLEQPGRSGETPP